MTVEGAREGTGTEPGVSAGPFPKLSSMADDKKRAGWYPDPDGIPGERWWNGAGWSDSRRGGAAASAAPVIATAAAVPVPVPVAVTVPVPVPPPAGPPTPVVYSASNPAPQRPDPYAPGRAATWGTAVLSTAPGRVIDASVNRDAFYGFIAGLVSIFFNIFFAVSIIAVVFSVKGMARARQLRAEGAPSTLMGLAVAGLAMGVLSTVIAVVSFIVFFVSAITFDVG